MTTTVAKLLEQKRQLIEQLQGDPGPEEREQIEQLLAKIDFKPQDVRLKSGL